MKVIQLDGREWGKPLDFYDALLSALGAPEWHGRSIAIAALVDSMIVGDINAVQAPYRVVVVGVSQIDEIVFDGMIQAFAVLARHGAQAQITSTEASLEISNGRSPS